MSKVWREKFDPHEHFDQSDSFGHLGLQVFSADTPHVTWVYKADVRGYIFVFVSRDQARDCLACLLERTHPDRRKFSRATDRWEVQRWYEQLPDGVKSGAWRSEAISALEHLVLLADDTS